MNPSSEHPAAQGHDPDCASLDRLPDPGPEGEGTFDERGRYQPVCDCGASAAQVRRWTERDDSGRVWLYWYEPSSDPRESRSWLNRTLIGVPA